LAEILPKPCKIEYLLAKKTDYPSKGWEFFTGDYLGVHEAGSSSLKVPGIKAVGEFEGAPH